MGVSGSLRVSLYADPTRPVTDSVYPHLGIPVNHSYRMGNVLLGQPVCTATSTIFRNKLLEVFRRILLVTAVP